MPQSSMFNSVPVKEVTESTKKIISLFLVLLISSCADNQKREEWREEKLTCDQTLQNVSFDSLRTKMAINSLYAKASFDMLTNSERVNENEKALLRELALVYEDCYEKKSYSLTGGSKYIDILRNIDRQSTGMAKHIIGMEVATRTLKEIFAPPQQVALTATILLSLQVS